jgi:HK97 family phage major capsid protein
MYASRIAKAREQVQALLTEVKAINAVAETENRDYTEDETARLDSITGDSGEITALTANIDKWSKADAAITTAMVQVNAIQANRDFGIQSPSSAPVIRVPARAKRTSALTAFANNDEGERAAYASGQWLRAVVGKSPTARQWCTDHGVLNAMSEGDDLKGGNLVPPEMESAIIKRMEEYGVFPRYVRQTTMASEQKTIPRRLSGLTVYFPGEGNAITDSDVTYNQVNLTAKKATTLTKLSSELNEDSIVSIANEVADEIAYAHAVKIDQIGFLGDGLTSSGGIVGLDSALLAGATATATSTTIGALTLVEAEAAVAKLMQYPGIRPVWFVHSAIFWNGLARLQVAAGGNAVMDVGSGPVPQFLGYPVVFTQALSSAGTTGTTWGFIGDLSLAATMGMRRGLSIATDSSVYFATDQIAIRSTYRYDISVHEVGTASLGGPIIKCKLG